MRLFSSICVLLWTTLASVHARSATGDRLLVVLEDAAEKENYQQFWADLECEMRITWRGSTSTDTSIARSFELSFESPKTESLSLFKLGALAYDHVLLLPPKSKGPFAGRH